MPDLKVGDSLWVYDRYRPVYDKTGQVVHQRWSRLSITGETRTSWLLGEAHRLIVAKTDLHIRGEEGRYGVTAFTESEKDDALWISENRARILEKVQRAGAPLLRRIDEAIDEQ